MPRMSYSGTTGATVTYGITNADDSVDTAQTSEGVTAAIEGDVRTKYTVEVDDSKRGMTIDWYEDGEYIVSEEIPLDVLTPIDALPTAAQNADAVWDEAVADHVTSGTFGRFLQRVYRYFFNKTLHTNTSMVVYADDGTTSDAVMAVSGDTSSVTKGAAS